MRPLPSGKGPKGDTGAPGAKGDPGPSDGFTDSNSNTATWTGAEQILATLNLPAGAYILNADLTANNNATTTQTVSCRMLGGGVFARANSIGLGPQLDQDRVMVALTGSVSSSAALTMTLRCTASSTEGNFLDANFTAVKVATLTETS